MKIGDRVWWRRLERGGYGYRCSHYAVVVGFSQKRVKIALWSNRLQSIKYRHVNEDNLFNRTVYFEKLDTKRENT